MTPEQIRDPDELDAALAAPRFLLFKHSPVCSISRAAFAQYAEFSAENPDLETGWIDVIDQRPWSARVAEEAGVEHQSPQAILIEDGRVVWHASHGGITTESLEDAL